METTTFSKKILSTSDLFLIVLKRFAGAEKNMASLTTPNLKIKGNLYSKSFIVLHKGAKISSGHYFAYDTEKKVSLNDEIISLKPLPKSSLYYMVIYSRKT
jgi:hypothetical protein